MLSKGDALLYKRWSGQSVSSTNLSEKNTIISNNSETCTTMGNFQIVHVQDGEGKINSLIALGF